MRRSARQRGRRLRRAAVLVWLVSSAVAPARAASAQTPEALAEPLLSLHTSFEHYWRRYLEAASVGDAEVAKRMLDEIRRLRVERNAFNLHDVGLSFVYQGFGFLDAGDLAAARSHFVIARELAPDLPTAYWGLARLAEREGGLGYPRAIVHRIRAQLAALRSEGNGAFASWNLVFLLFASLMVVVFGFALLMLYRYGLLLYHDLEERFGDSFGPKTVLALTLALLLLPAVVTAGYGWLAPFWLAVTFAYQSVKERVVSVLSLLILLAAAPFIELYVVWARTVSNPLYQAALSSVTGTFDVRDVELLRRAVAAHPNDRDLQFLLATQYKNLGEYELAAIQYRRILDARPDDHEARINLGNIYFAQRDWDGALVQYNQALESSPRLAIAHYNKSLAHAENFQFAEREEARARAEAIDPGFVARHERRTGDYRVAADARLDEMAILGKFYGLADGVRPRRVTSFLAPSVLDGWGLRFVGAAVLSGALILVLQLAFRERTMTQRCWKCGSAFCARCQIGTGRKGLCTQCYHLFFMKDGVSAAARNEKLQQVERDSRRKTIVFRVLSVLAPGAGQLGEGMTVPGLVFLFVWVGGALTLATGGAVYPLPDGLLGLSSSVPYFLVAPMALVLVLANVVSRPMVRG